MSECAIEFVGRRDEVEAKLVSAGLLDGGRLKLAADKYDIWGEDFVDLLCGYVFAVLYDAAELIVRLPVVELLRAVIRSPVPRCNDWQLQCRLVHVVGLGAWPEDIERYAAAMADAQKRQEKIQWHLRQAQKIADGMKYVGLAGPGEATPQRENAKSVYERLVRSPRKRAI